MNIILLILSLLFNFLALAEGFLPDTLVKTKNCDSKIIRLSNGQELITLNSQGSLEYQPVIGIYKKRVNEIVKVVVDNQKIQCAPNQKFYNPHEGNWIQAKDVKIGQPLLRINNEVVYVDKVKMIPQETEVYCITVKDNHNYFTTANGILVHNAIPLIVVGVNIAIGSTLAECTTTLTLAVGGLAGAIFYSIFKGRRYRDIEVRKGEDYYWQSSSEHNKGKKNNRNNNQQNRQQRPSNDNNNNQDPYLPGLPIQQQDKKSNPNGLYEGAPYHHQNSKGNQFGGKSIAPTNGQAALDNSIDYGNGKNRIGVSNNEFVVLNQTQNNNNNPLFHGHVRDWKDLTQNMKRALIRGKFTNAKGKILK